MSASAWPEIPGNRRATPASHRCTSSASGGGDASVRGTSFDAIIIGSGIGGLGTAALLARHGMKALVLERHYVPGGLTHTFHRKGYEWDVGLHYLGKVHDPKAPLRRVFDYVLVNRQSPTEDLLHRYREAGADLRAALVLGHVALLEGTWRDGVPDEPRVRVASEPKVVFMPVRPRAARPVTKRSVWPPTETVSPLVSQRDSPRKRLGRRETTAGSVVDAGRGLIGERRPALVHLLLEPEQASEVGGRRQPADLRPDDGDATRLGFERDQSRLL